MRIGVLSDIHGNLPAYEAVLGDMPKTDALVCAGDVVGYNPWPKACVEYTKEREIPCVSGNHDRAVVQASAFRFNRMAQAGVEHAREQLDQESLDWLDGLPTSQSLFDDRVRIVHGHPADPDRYTFPEDFASDLLGTEDLLVMGHTHVQHVEHYDSGIVLNPGSVGQPRDGDPRAAYAIVHLDDGDVDLERVSYDIDRVKAAIEDAGLPPSLGERLTAGR